MNDRKDVGRFSETFATQYLSLVLGWRLVERNWRCRAGEVDLLFKDGETLVIVEVRSRRHVSRGEVIHAVGVEKVRQLRRLCPYVERWFGTENLRIDVVALSVNKDASTSLTVSELIHVRNIDVEL